jgi:hypothetical protein
VKDEHKKTFRRFSSLKEALGYMQRIETEEMSLTGYDENKCIVKTGQ